MNRIKCCATSMTLILAVIAVSLPDRAAASGRDDERPIRLYASAESGPIGKVVSIGGARIDGRPAVQEQLIWGGELLQAPANRSVHITLDSVGRVILKPGALAKFTVAPKEAGETRVLVASLAMGIMVVTLHQNAEAYVEAGGRAIISSRGASFRVGTGEEGAVVYATTGTVSPGVQTPQARYTIRPVGGRANVSVRLRKSREVQVQVTDENDRPVPDLPIIFTVGGTGASLGTGATTVTVTTNALGIASTSVTGTAVGPSSITATIAGTNTSTTIGVTTATAGILTGTTIAVVAAAVAAGTTAAVVATQNDESEQQIRVARPPRITP
ncbi:MAG TPA: Ig-like domain-containing protein [Blastocatellia bacterium]|nr:Ig-like domain-containing protein [Blastocatellia bacterium]